MPAGELCLHEACHKTEVPHSVPAMHLQTLKLVSVNGVAQQVQYTSFLLGAF